MTNAQRNRLMDAYEKACDDVRLWLHEAADAEADLQYADTEDDVMEAEFELSHCDSMLFDAVNRRDAILSQFPEVRYDGIPWGSISRDDGG